jgi:GGDEF domain-containing protein
VLRYRRWGPIYPFVEVMTHDHKRVEPKKPGAKDVLTTPLDAAVLEATMANADRLTALMKRMGDESEDFPSAGGVIAKSAFNQLFLSCIDRADRYAERSFLVFIGIRNYKKVVEQSGAYAAEYATAKLSQYLVRLRRQSDIIAQTGRSEYCLMLQRPQYDSEPIEAANRFAAALEKLEDICANDGDNIEVAVSLISIPVGQLHVEHVVTYNKKAARSSG